MSTETSERQAHLRAIIITSLTALIGVGAAVGSAMLTSGMGPESAVTADLPKFLVLGAIAVQLPVYQFAYDEWGGTKDFLFVGFMTFCFWFLSFGIIVNTGVFY